MDQDLEFLMEEIRADRKPAKKGRKKRKRRRGAGAAIFVIVFLLVGLAGLLLFWWMQRPERKLPGAWHQERDYTQAAILAAKDWFSVAEGSHKIDLNSYFGTITIGTDLVLFQDGSWIQTVDENDYTAAKEQAYLALEEALEDLLILRLEESGRTIQSREEAAQSITGTIGMSCREYLENYGPELLPSLEQLKTQLSGSGSWRAENGVLLRDGTGEAFLINTDLLVLSGSAGTEVYYRNAE